MKKVISYILEFIFIILLTIVILLTVFKFTILNKSYINYIFDKESFYTSFYEDIVDDLKGYFIQSGLGTDIVDEIVTEQLITNDFSSLVDAIYSSTKFELDTTIFEDNLTNAINNYVEENDITLSSSDEKEVEEFKSTIIDVYKNNILIYEKGTNALISYFDDLINITNIAILIILIIMIIILFIIYFLVKYKVLNRITNSIISSGMLLITIKLLTNNIYENILIYNYTITNMIISILNNILTIILIVGIIITIIGIIIEVLLNKKEA